MTEYAKVVDSPGLARDLFSKAIIAVDSSALSEHKKKKAMVTSLLNKNKTLENDVKDLNSRLDNMQNVMDRIIKLLEK